MKLTEQILKKLILEEMRKVDTEYLADSLSGTIKFWAHAGRGALRPGSHRHGAATEEIMQVFSEADPSPSHEKLKDLPVITQVANNDLVHNYHKYVVRFKDKETRDKVKNKLNAKIHYDSPISKNSMFNLIPCLNAQKASDTILSLPCHPYVTEEEIDQICMKLELIVGIIP